MAKKEMSFDEWWVTPKVRRIVGMVYSLGAAIVIIGAMFKILHLPGAGIMLGCGMTIEAILFTLGIFDKPHKEYHWDNIFPGLKEGAHQQPVELNSELGNQKSSSFNAAIPEEEMKKLADSIKNLSTTADQLTGIAKVTDITNTFAKNITNASEAAEGFASKQKALDEATGNMLASYKGITESMTAVQANSQQYVDKTEAINKNLGSINSMYEMQIKHVQEQIKSIEVQNAKVSTVTSNVEQLHLAVEESAKDMTTYQNEAKKLAKQITSLNDVYGNMLNALKS